MLNNSLSEVKAWEEVVIIPTYKIGAPDKNPMFLEKRVYQGSSGVVYPHPVIDKVYDEKEDKPYKALFLENEYLKIMVLPELGGRIQMAYDKTNDYHFVYYNRVIKPALVGLAGPWISGGIEFNWPQHHRPSTFDPVDYSIEENPDGSKTVWVSEIEKMFGTKGMAGFTLYQDKAYLEITGKLYNRTSLPQTFLWWANPAVHVDEHYQSVFPPDVHAVYDHGKRDVSSFPIATGTYYKVDYSPGTDISRYQNIPVPTSYMAVNSAFDFVGGYHYGKKAGLLHVANHHISPGKKQWTWGCGEFGQAWDRQLTDEDGPYFELMVGVFTDNQPDFSWIMPNEERRFTQYFMPYKNIGYVKNATTEAAVNLEIEDNQAIVHVYVTSPQNHVSVRLLKGLEVLLYETLDLSPNKTYHTNVSLPEGVKLEQLQISVNDNSGRELVGYTPVTRKEEAIPDPATPIGEPKDIATNEALYLAGLHLEQYRHASYSPVAYFEEALRRDPTDIRNNNALGRWYVRRGQFVKAEPFFRKAIETMTRHNPNPYDGEPLYNLGLTLVYQEKWDEAYAFFYKSTWNASWQNNAYLQLARIDMRKGNFTQALQSATYSVIRNYHGFKARHLKTVALRKLGRLKEAEIFARETLSIDSFDFASSNELYLILQAKGQAVAAAETLQRLQQQMRNNSHTYIQIALDYAQAGLYAEAIELLEQISATDTHPLTFYYLAFFYNQSGQALKARELATKGFACSPDRVFPNHLEDIAVLQKVAELNPQDYKAWYYLGNLWYDKRQYEVAIAAWEKSREIFDELPTVHRNLGIAYFNRLAQELKALESFEKAFSLDRTDSRILFELDQLYKRLNHAIEARLAFLNRYQELICDRDDLFIEYVTLHNLAGKHAEAARLLASRTFHPWEGGEGKVSGQHIQTHVELAKQAISEEQYQQAVTLLHTAEVYPTNLGEGKLYGAQENDIHYWLGCAYDGLGDQEKATFYWEKAAVGISEPAPAIFYNDQPPDKIFYQGQALLKLGRREEAERRFQNLIGYGEAHMNDQVKIDFFAVSLPDLMIFDDDLSKRNKIHCHYLIGLGQLGAGRPKEAKVHLDQVLAMDTAHQGAIVHRRLLQTILDNQYTIL
jgi:tetratricopeptide (TPR) repeat protein